MHRCDSCTLELDTIVLVRMPDKDLWLCPSCKESVVSAFNAIMKDIFEQFNYPNKEKK
jgi:hypothetical protein